MLIDSIVLQVVCVLFLIVESAMQVVAVFLVVRGVSGGINLKTHLT